MPTIYTLTANDVALLEFWTANDGANRSILQDAMEADGFTSIQKFLEADRATTAPTSLLILGWEYDTGKVYKALGTNEGDWALALGGAPEAHAANHASAGSDPLMLAQSQITDLTSDLAAKAAAATLTAHTGDTNNPHGVTKAQVGLGNCENTSDANKPVSTAQQTALNLKANLASPTFTGTPAAPTASPGTNTTQLATTAFVAALGALKEPTQTAASQAEAEAGSGTSIRSWTPQRIKQAIDALGGGGSAIATPKVIHVTKEGHDTLGDGSLGSPYLTVQKAYDVAYAAFLLDALPRCISVGVGTFATVNATGWPLEIGLKGCGHKLTVLTGINSSGTDGQVAIGDNGGTGLDVHIRGMGINVGDIVANGGNGGSGADSGSIGGNGANGGNGGNGGSVTLEDVAFESISVIGGNGSGGGNGGNSDDGSGPVPAGNGGNGGNGGNSGTVLLRRCVHVDMGGEIVILKGAGGSAGNPGLDFGGGSGNSGSGGADGSDGTCKGFLSEILYSAGSGAYEWIRCLVKAAGSATMTDSTEYADLTP